jgi:hypothetical protein
MYTGGGVHYEVYSRLKARRPVGVGAQFRNNIGLYTFWQKVRVPYSHPYR